MSPTTHGLSSLDRLVRECLDRTSLMLEPLPQTFGYLLPSSKTGANTGPNEVTGSLTKAQIVDAFNELADDMFSNENLDGPTDAGMTFLGQFVDHDITHDATSSIGSKIDPRSIRNVRTPSLDLDCVYGDGPDATPHLYTTNRARKGTLLFGRADNGDDLARNDLGTALIGDPRNDENIIVSQVQGAFIQLHNILMSGMNDSNQMANDIHACASMGVRTAVLTEAIPPADMDFEMVRRFVRLHYQYLVLHELLPAFVTQRCIDLALSSYVFGDDGAVMPVEFSGACYRFGHATVQANYVLQPGSDPVDLFKMTGFGRRTPDSNIDMTLFFGSGAQKARPVGTTMAETLMKLPDNVVAGTLKWGDLVISEERAKKLNLRNMLRDRTALRCASGQQVARWLTANVPSLGINEIAAPEILTNKGITKTPLWFYQLQEADASGGKLDGVGGMIVASVLVRLLRLDPESVLHTSFVPWSGFGSSFSMRGLMDWISAHKGQITNPSELYSG